MLTWVAYTSIPLLGIALGVMFTPWGPAALALIANSRLARGAAIAAAVAWALVVGASRIRRAGRAEGLAEVERANTAAKADRERIEAAVRDLPADDVTEELSRWSR